jgi:hypothetical protein
VNRDIDPEESIHNFTQSVWGGFCIAVPTAPLLALLRYFGCEWVNPLVLAIAMFGTFAIASTILNLRANRASRLRTVAWEAARQREQQEREERHREQQLREK